MIDDLRPSSCRGLLHPVLWLTGLTLAVALVLMPFAITRTDLGGVAGLAIAAAVCYLAGIVAEVVAWSLAGRVQPLGIMVFSMTFRMLPPLATCVYLAAQGRGRQDLPFICYLLAFYLATLALETVLAVKRASQSASPTQLGSR